MRARHRLERLEHRRARKTTEYWIHYEGGEDDTTAISSLTGEHRPVSELPADCHHIVVTYDRKDSVSLL